MERVLKLENVGYKYKDSKDDYVFSNINFEFEKGKVYAIKGKSGAGKTTLLSLICGLDKKYDGNIYYQNKNLKKLDLDRYRNNDIGIVFQSYNLLVHMNAIENVVLSMDINGIKEKNKNKVALEYLKQVVKLRDNVTV